MTEAQYEAKFRDMQKYVPFIQRVIDRLKVNNEHMADNPRKAQLEKMEKLHDLLTNKVKNIKVETLEKCEGVIKRLQNKLEMNEDNILNKVQLKQAPDKGASSKPFKISQNEETCGPASPPPEIIEDVLEQPVVIPTERRCSPILLKEKVKQFKQLNEPTKIKDSSIHSTKELNFQNLREKVFNYDNNHTASNKHQDNNQHHSQHSHHHRSNYDVRSTTSHNHHQSSRPNTPLPREKPATATQKLQTVKVVITEPLPAHVKQQHFPSSNKFLPRSSICHNNLKTLPQVSTLASKKPEDNNEAYSPEELWEEYNESHNKLANPTHSASPVFKRLGAKISETPQQAKDTTSTTKNKPSGRYTPIPDVLKSPPLSVNDINNLLLESGADKNDISAIGTRRPTKQEPDYESSSNNSFEILRKKLAHSVRMNSPILESPKQREDKDERITASTSNTPQERIALKYNPHPRQERLQSMSSTDGSECSTQSKVNDPRIKMKLAASPAGSAPVSNVNVLPAINLNDPRLKKQNFPNLTTTPSPLRKNLLTTPPCQTSTPIMGYHQQQQNSMNFGNRIDPRISRQTPITPARRPSISQPQYSSEENWDTDEEEKPKTYVKTDPRLEKKREPPRPEHHRPESRIENKFDNRFDSQARSSTQKPSNFNRNSLGHTRFPGDAKVDKIPVGRANSEENWSKNCEKPNNNKSCPQIISNPQNKSKKSKNKSKQICQKLEPATTITVPNPPKSDTEDDWDSEPEPEQINVKPKTAPIANPFEKAAVPSYHNYNSPQTYISPVHTIGPPPLVPIVSPSTSYKPPPPPATQYPIMGGHNLTFPLPNPAANNRFSCAAALNDNTERFKYFEAKKQKSEEPRTYKEFREAKERALAQEAALKKAADEAEAKRRADAIKEANKEKEKLENSQQTNDNNNRQPQKDLNKKLEDKKSNHTETYKTNKDKEKEKILNAAGESTLDKMYRTQNFCTQFPKTNISFKIPKKKTEEKPKEMEMEKSKTINKSETKTTESSKPKDKLEDKPTTNKAPITSKSTEKLGQQNNENNTSKVIENNEKSNENLMEMNKDKTNNRDPRCRAKSSKQIIHEEGKNKEQDKGKVEEKNKEKVDENNKEKVEGNNKEKVEENDKEKLQQKAAEKNDDKTKETSENKTKENMETLAKSSESPQPYGDIIITSAENQVTLKPQPNQTALDKFNKLAQDLNPKPQRILRRRNTMVVFDSAPLVDKEKLRKANAMLFEDVQEEEKRKRKQEEEERQIARRNKHLEEMFKKTDDNCTVSTQNIITGKRRTRATINFNETVNAINVFKHLTIKDNSLNSSNSSSTGGAQQPIRATRSNFKIKLNKIDLKDKVTKMVKEAKEAREKAEESESESKAEKETNANKGETKTKVNKQQEDKEKESEEEEQDEVQEQIYKGVKKSAKANKLTKTNVGKANKPTEESEQSEEDSREIATKKVDKPKAKTKAKKGKKRQQDSEEESETECEEGEQEEASKDVKHTKAKKVTKTKANKTSKTTAKEETEESEEDSEQLTKKANEVVKQTPQNKSKTQETNKSSEQKENNNKTKVVKKSKPDGNNTSEMSATKETNFKPISPEHEHQNCAVSSTSTDNSPEDFSTETPSSSTLPNTSSMKKELDDNEPSSTASKSLNPTPTPEANVEVLNEIVDKILKPNSDREHVLSLLGQILSEEKLGLIKSIIETSQKQNEEQQITQQNEMNNEEEHSHEKQIKQEKEISTPKTSERNNKEKQKENNQHEEELEELEQKPLKTLKPAAGEGKKMPVLNKKKRSELDRLNEDIRDMFICEGVLTATGRRMCTIMGKEVETDKKSSPETETTNKRKPNLRRSLRSLRTQEETEEDDNNSLDTRNSEMSLEDTLERSNSNESTPQRRMPVLKPHTPIKIPEEVAVNKTKTKETNKRKIDNKLPFKNKKAKINKEDSESEEKDSETEAEDEEEKVENEKESQPNTSIIAIKNNNVHWHNQSKYTTWCMICEKRLSAMASSVHYKTHHRENYISRMAPVLLQQFKQGKLNKPLFGVKKQKQNSWFFRCPFCLKYFNTPLPLWLEHFLNHTVEFRYECSMCHRGNNRKITVTRHLKSCEGATLITSAVKLTKPTEIKAHICHLCNFLQLKRANLERHYIEQHQMDKKKIDLLGYTITLFDVENVECVTEDKAAERESEAWKAIETNEQVIDIEDEEELATTTNDNDNSATSQGLAEGEADEVQQEVKERRDSKLEANEASTSEVIKENDTENVKDKPKAAAERNTEIESQNNEKDIETETEQSKEISKADCSKRDKLKPLVIKKTKQNEFETKQNNEQAKDTTKDETSATDSSDQEKIKPLIIKKQKLNETIKADSTNNEKVITELPKSQKDLNIINENQNSTQVEDLEQLKENSMKKNKETNSKDLNSSKKQDTNDLNLNKDKDVEQTKESISAQSEVSDQSIDPIQTKELEQSKESTSAQSKPSTQSKDLKQTSLKSTDLEPSNDSAPSQSKDSVPSHSKDSSLPSKHQASEHAKVSNKDPSTQIPLEKGENVSNKINSNIDLKSTSKSNKTNETLPYDSKDRHNTESSDPDESMVSIYLSETEEPTSSSDCEIINEKETQQDMQDELLNLAAQAAEKEQEKEPQQNIQDELITLAAQAEEKEQETEKLNETSLTKESEPQTSISDIISNSIDFIYKRGTTTKRKSLTQDSSEAKKLCQTQANVFMPTREENSNSPTIQILAQSIISIEENNQKGDINKVKPITMAERLSQRFKELKSNTEIRNKTPAPPIQAPKENVFEKLINDTLKELEKEKDSVAQQKINEISTASSSSAFIKAKENVFGSLNQTVYESQREKEKHQQQQEEEQEKQQKLLEKALKMSKQTDNQNQHKPEASKAPTPDVITVISDDEDWEDIEITETAPAVPSSNTGNINKSKNKGLYQKFGLFKGNNPKNKKHLTPLAFMPKKKNKEKAIVHTTLELSPSNIKVNTTNNNNNTASSNTSSITSSITTSITSSISSITTTTSAKETSQRSATNSPFAQLRHHLGFKPVMNIMEDLLPDSPCNDPIDLVPELAPLEPLQDLNDISSILDSNLSAVNINANNNHTSIEEALDFVNEQQEQRLQDSQNTNGSSNSNSNSCSSSLQAKTASNNIYHVGFSRQSVGENSFKFYCLLENCSFLFSSDAMGLETHFMLEHSQIKWNGYCYSCQAQCFPEMEGREELSITKEIKHMMDKHANKSSLDINNADSNSCGATTQDERPKIKLRRLTGDCLSRSTPEITAMTTNSLDGNVTDNKTKTSAASCMLGALLVAKPKPPTIEMPPQPQLPLTEPLLLDSNRVTGAGTPSAFSNVNGDFLITSVSSVASSQTKQTPLQISSVISLNRPLNSPSTTTDPVQMPKISNVRTLAPKAGSLWSQQIEKERVELKEAAAESLEVSRILENANKTSIPTEPQRAEDDSPVIVAETVPIAQNKTGEFVITQTLSAQYNDFSSAALGFNINIAASSTQDKTPAESSASSSAATPSSGTITSRQYKCMAAGCKFVSRVPVAMSDHLRFHERRNFTNKRDYFACGFCFYTASDVEDYMKHAELYHIISKTGAAPPAINTNETDTATSLTKKIQHILNSSGSTNTLIVNRNTYNTQHMPPQNAPQVQDTEEVYLKKLRDTIDEIVGPTGLADDKLYRCIIKNCHSQLTEATFLTHVLYHINTTGHNPNNYTYKCPHCNSQYNRPAGIKAHIKNHARNRYFCYLCEQTSTNPGQLLKHFSEQHWHTLNMYTKELLKPKISNDGSNLVLDSGYYVAYTQDLSDEEVRKFGEKLILEWQRKKSGSKTHFKSSEIDLLPMTAIFTRDINCGECEYKTKVRTNMFRHLQMHKQNPGLTSKGGVTKVFSVDPVNPVPCLNSSERFFDKMTNLASSSLIPSSSTSTSNSNSKSNFKIPYAYVLDSKRFTCGCSGCNYHTISEELFRTHLSTLHSTTMTYRCAICQEEICKRGITIDRVVNHLRFHGACIYRCEECNYLHYLRYVVERHVNEKHATMKVNIVNHERSSEENAEGIATPVPFAGKKYKETSETTQTSIPITRSTNSESSAPKPTSSAASTATKGKGKWVCDVCGHKAGSVAQIQSHCQQQHGVKNQYKCAHCNFGSQQLSQILGHIDDKHQGKAREARTVYYKEDCAKEKVADTRPLWQRNDPTRIRHIRGILMEDEEESEEYRKKLALTEEDIEDDDAGDEEVEIEIEIEDQDEEWNGSNYLIGYEFSCFHCEVKTQTFEDLKEHHYKNLHNGEEETAKPFWYRLLRKFCCPECRAFVGIHSELEYHLKNFHYKTRFYAADVTMSENSDTSLRLLCGFCPVHCANADDLLRHQLRVQHVPQDIRIDNNEQIMDILSLGQAQVSYQCTLCTDIFPNRVAIVQHACNAHGGEESFSFRELSNSLIYRCHYCCFTSTKEIDLLRHMINHFSRFQTCQLCRAPQTSFNVYMQHCYAEHKNTIHKFRNLYPLLDIRKFLLQMLIIFPSGLVVNKRNLLNTKYGKTEVIEEFYEEMYKISQQPPIPRLSIARLVARKSIEAQHKHLDANSIQDDILESMQPKPKPISKRRRTLVVSLEENKAATNASIKPKINIIENKPPAAISKRRTTVDQHEQQKQHEEFSAPLQMAKISKRRRTVAVDRDTLFSSNLLSNTSHSLLTAKDTNGGKKRKTSSATPSPQHVSEVTYPLNLDLEPFSYYGKKPEVLDLSKIYTKVAIGGIKTPLTIDKFKLLFNIECQLKLTKCDDETQIEMMNYNNYKHIKKACPASHKLRYN